MSDNAKWILSRHTSDLGLLIQVSLLLKKGRNGISADDKDRVATLMRKSGTYNPRYCDINQSTIDSKINQMAFYMFGYKDNRKFLFSPLGNLFLKYKEDSVKRNKIFLTMLWGLQYRHPHSKTDRNFNLYPMRLLFKLMSEKKLNNRLFVSEAAYFVVVKKNITIDSYDELVKDILSFRLKSDEEVKRIFLKEALKSTTLVNAVYEFDYYLGKILKATNLVDISIGKKIATLRHGKTTKRSLKKNYYSVSETMKKLVSKLESNFSFLDEPISLTKAKQELEIKKEIYNFYPKILLDEIGEGTESYDILKLPDLIDKYSKNENNENANNFEDSLKEGFNTFYNVNAEKIGGPGNTDIKCIYLEDDSIFAVEAKSTQNKLTAVNDGRLKEHRIKIGAKYTIVITPGWVPAVERDIQGTNSVIIKANTFSEYLYNSIREDERNINYTEIHHLIVDNLGKDISNQISDITMNKFAASGELYPDATN